MARRKNATFTGKPHTRVSTSLAVFYSALHKRYPGNTPIPIPPLETVHTKHGPVDQALIFADFIVRKIAPIALEKLPLDSYAMMLADCEPITDLNSAEAAIELVEAGAVEIEVQPDGRLSADGYDRASRVATCTLNTVLKAKNAAAQARKAPPRGHVEQLALEAVVTAERCIAIAAEYDFDGTWNAVNEMLQAL